MNKMEMKNENLTGNIKLYSLIAIGGATLLGGPLAAGYMVGENFKALNKPKDAKFSLITGVLFTIAIFVMLFTLSEDIVDKIPRSLIPFAYTAIVLGIVEWKQGEALRLHKENGNTFFSGWRATGVGFVSFLILFAGILAYAYLSIGDVYKQYDKELDALLKNENETMVFYDYIDTASNEFLIQELENFVIPKWEENIEIVKRMSNLKDLSPEFIEQNKILLRYSELRLETFELFKKTIEEDTDEYALELQILHEEIDAELEKMN